MHGMKTKSRLGRGTKRDTSRDQVCAIGTVSTGKSTGSRAPDPTIARPVGRAWNPRAGIQNVVCARGAKYRIYCATSGGWFDLAACSAKMRASTFRQIAGTRI